MAKAGRAKIEDWLRAAREDRRREVALWVAAILVCGATAAAWDHGRAAEGDRAEASRAAATMDVLIPAGFALVPIQVTNFESLDSILGQEGVVDLFLPPADGIGRARRVASNVRILRSPQDASHFAVLVPATESHRLVSQAGAFFVAVQNPRRHGAAFERFDETVDGNGGDKPAAAPFSQRRRASRIHVEQPDAG
jgi:hypothetical protein